MTNAISERGGETTRLGSFEIVRQLARGGMAEIFLARTSGPSGFEKLVVLKKILPKYAGKPRFVQLFLDEAKLAASLDHPHIAQVYDIGIADGSYFFTMEYLHGEDVRSILHRTWRTGERFPIEHAVQIARHVASALHFAHEKQGADGAPLGIVHRDVSPSNVIVTYDGATKLLDFGVAKTTARTVKTRTGTLKGKISYMSPEQARGAPIDRRSDIFSLGIVLWEMVTTQRLYRGENDLATLQLIITQQARPPSTVRPDVPPELERIVLRALAQNPDDRYATAEQLVLELDELAREHKLKQTSHA
ncbi:MAG: serine/threonine protein kinase, partial [Myxococcales bacterium]|nr:serine/threonine protein kinase [Myxococcales bacterium]